MILGIALAVCSNIMSKFINIRKLIFVEYYPMYSKNICDSYGENHGFQTSVLLFCTVGLDSLLRFYLHGAEVIFTILEMCLYTRNDQYSICCQCL